MLETSDLILRSGVYSDSDHLYETFWSRPEVFVCMFNRPCATPKAAQKKTCAYADMHREVPTEFFVCEKASGKAIGIAGIKKMGPGLYTITDIAIGPDFWHRGYGKQILQALTRFGAELGAQRILYECFRENAASRHLALACGYRYVRTDKAELQKDGRDVWMEHFEIVRAIHADHSSHS